MEKEQSDFSIPLRDIRSDFTKDKLTEDALGSDPFSQFNSWLKSALDSGNKTANAMVLSTVDSQGMPSSRIMLLRDVKSGGFTFFTNYESRKGKELEQNKKASLLFFWPEQERQVRVQGSVKFLPAAEADEYFSSRPFESRVGAWASAQSRVINDRAELEKRFREKLALHADGAVPRPPYWGGYVLVPASFEFWQGGAGRLHDRIQFRWVAEQKWIRERLMP